MDIDESFPEPIVIAKRNFYRQGAITRWVAKMAHEPEPAPHPDDDKLLTTRQVRVRLGNVSDMWIWRKRRPVEQREVA